MINDEVGMVDEISIQLISIDKNYCGTCLLNFFGKCAIDNEQVLQYTESCENFDKEE